MMFGTAVSVLLFLLWSLVEVHSQTPPAAPYLTFMGETLPNNSYVDLSLVGGINSSAEIVCHTDLRTCCGGDGDLYYDRGNWFFPNGTILPNVYYSIVDAPFVERRTNMQSVKLRRGPISGYIPSGIYHCSIETVAVHSNDSSDNRASIYVGVYGSGGEYIYTTEGELNNYRLCMN